MAFFLFPMKEGERSLDIFKIVGRLALDGTDEFNRDIDGAKSKGAALAKAVGNGLATVAKVGAAALGVASTAMVAVGKASLDAYAEYEQLVGGVDTLFKESSGKLQEYASQAFMTAGMSANEYMSTTIKFSASLLQSLGNDTAKAAEYADMAIRDMADNANKMGNDISRIQEAYQSFAKGQYQLLDNLALGYQGTKTEMERLLKDANRINREHGITSNYTIDNLADVYEAIHVVQEEMGIYGTTAAEASETITGSLNATKAAWKNLLVGFADDDADLGLLIDNFVSSLTTATKNIVPRLAQILGGVGQALKEIMPVLAEELPGILEELLPGVIAGAGGLIKGLVEALPELMVVLWDALNQVMSGLWNYVSIDLFGTDYDWDSAMSDLKNGLTRAWEEMWPEIEETWNAIGQPIFDSVQRCVGIVAKAFSDNWPKMKRDFQSFCKDIDFFWNENLQPCLEAIGGFIEDYLAPAFEWLFGTVINSAIESFVFFFDDIWNTSLLPLLTGITDFLTGVFTADWELAFDGLKGILNGWLGFWESIWNLCVSFWTGVFTPVFDWFGEKWNEMTFFVELFIADVTRRWEDFKESVAEKLAEIVASVISEFTEIKQEIGSKVNDAMNKAKEAFERIKKSIEDAMEEAKNAVSEKWEEIKGFFSDALEVGKKIVEDIKEGIRQAWDGLVQWFNNLWNSLFGNRDVNVNVNGSDNTSGGNGHATGLNYVPYDEYPAVLHQGEAVLNAVQARAWRSGEGTNGNINKEVTDVLLMILEAIQEGNSKETVFRLNAREFGRAVRGAVSV